MNSKYVGTELDVFSHAANWKNYYSSVISPYLTGRVLEVGAGIGTTTKSLCNGSYKQWICLEPDHLLVKRIEVLIHNNEIAGFCEVRTGKLSELNETNLNTVIYIDVLEHIEDDRSELLSVLNILAKGGNLVILSPAHQWLYSEFDQKIGHYRRYTKRSLKALVPKGFRCIKLIYIDSIGMMASFANKTLLKTGNPSIQQILFWDKVLIPISRVIDRLLFFTLGKSIIGIWEKI